MNEIYNIIRRTSSPCCNFFFYVSFNFFFQLVCRNFHGLFDDGLLLFAPSLKDIDRYKKDSKKAATEDEDKARHWSTVPQSKPPFRYNLSFSDNLRRFAFHQSPPDKFHRYPFLDVEPIDCWIPPHFMIFRAGYGVRIKGFKSGHLFEELIMPSVLLYDEWVGGNANSCGHVQGKSQAGQGSGEPGPNPKKKELTLNWLKALHEIEQNFSALQL